MKKILLFFIIVALLTLSVVGFYCYQWFSLSDVEKNCFNEINAFRHAPGGCEECEQAKLTSFYWYEWPDVLRQKTSKAYFDCLAK